MMIIVVTGGVGSGKSTVVDMFKQHGVPVISAVKDLYPESFLGESHGRLKKVARSLGRLIERQVYRQSTLVIPLNPIMREHIISTRSISQNKVRVFYDWVDG